MCIYIYIYILNGPHALLNNTICSLKDGIFSLKSIYMLARNLNPLNLVINLIAWVWKVVAPPKIQLFIYLFFFFFFVAMFT